ncbi:MAG TPA: FixH family protein [Saprospiraceae bacterium]|nr:FixH family protein [Saprospiraceae bacterium]
MQNQTGFSLNWGHGILSVILLFLVGIAFMVYVASKQNNEMVDDHYYQKELAYQGVIDASKNLQMVTEKSLVHQTIDNLVIQFPEGSFEQLVSGSIDLQRNDAKEKDLHFNVSTSGNGIFEIPKSTMTNGLYKIRISWVNKQLPYYAEENIFINK